MTDAGAAVLLHAARVAVRSAPGSGPLAPGPWTDLGIEHRDEGSAIGAVGVRIEPDEPTAEVRIALVEAARGRGYATEALQAVVEHLLGERDLARVVAVVPAADERGQLLLERAGLRVVAVDGDDLVYLRRGRLR